MKATKDKVENFESEIRSSKDRRKKVAWIVISYRSESGYEYRKSFEAEPYTCPQKMFKDAPESIEVSE